MPKGIYNRDHVTESARAKARGATGFIQKGHAWEIQAAHSPKEANSSSGRKAIVWTAQPYHTRNTREASRLYAQQCKNAQDPHSRYYGGAVHLLCDGVEIKSNKV